MRNPIRRVCEGRASLLAGVAASVAALVAVPSLTPVSAAPPGDEVFVSAGHVVVPGNPLIAFDISWIDPNLVEYMLADRSNAAIDVIPLIFNPPVFQIKPTGVNAFAGASPAGNDSSGPNGILTFNDPNNPIGIQLWAGDGPTANPVCGVMSICSTVKVFTDNGSLTSVIPTFGNHRADELCWAPPIGSGPGGRPGLIMVANDAESPDGTSFISIIPTDTNAGANPNIVLQKIVLPQANGIEQCGYDTTTGQFFLSIPALLGGGNGGVFVFNVGSGKTGIISATFHQINNTAACTAPQGLAIGPRQGGSNANGNPFNSDILLGCNGNPGGATGNTVTVWKGDPSMITNVYRGAGGADEVWYNDLGPAGFQGHYFVASGTPALAGGAMFTTIIDPLLPNTGPTFNDNALDQTITTGFKGGSAGSNHSVAAWSGTPGVGTPNALPLLEVVVIPVIASNNGSQSTLCLADAAKGCVTFFVISPPAPFPDNAPGQNF